MNNNYAIFAGGCFWCTESDFVHLNGVTEVISGYTGDSEEKATYEQVSSHNTLHRECVKVFYDNSKVDYEVLVKFHLRHIDPTDDGGQFYDRGNQYIPTIYYKSEFEKNTAQKLIDELESSKIFDKPINVKVEEEKPFYTAEEYHQKYFEKNYTRYCNYREGSGKDNFLNLHWGEKDWVSKNFQKPNIEELKKKLTPLQFDVTQNEATEAPFQNEYWNNEEDGIYVDIVTGEPLFDSKDKYDAGCGWASFTKPINEEIVETKIDNRLSQERIEVHSKNAKTHLGHIFDDGPKDKGGKRFCINSASLKFIPRNKSNL